MTGGDATSAPGRVACGDVVRRDVVRRDVVRRGFFRRGSCLVYGQGRLAISFSACSIARRFRSVRPSRTSRKSRICSVSIHICRAACRHWASTGSSQAAASSCRGVIPLPAHARAGSPTSAIRSITRHWSSVGIGQRSGWAVNVGPKPAHAMGGNGSKRNRTTTTEEHPPPRSWRPRRLTHSDRVAPAPRVLRGFASCRLNTGAAF